MGVSNDANGWWEGLWLGEYRFGYNNQVMMQGKDKPAASVLMYRRGVDVRLEHVPGVRIGCAERLRICERSFKFVGNNIRLEICSA